MQEKRKVGNKCGERMRGPENKTVGKLKIKPFDP